MFHKGKWRLIQLLAFLIKFSFIFKQTHCAGGPTTTKVDEVHGVTGDNLDHLYTQLLLDTDDIVESEAFDQLHCRLSTFLLVGKINEIRQHPEQREKFKGWFKEKGKKKTKTAEEDKRKANLLDFRNRISEFNKMQNEGEFAGLQCRWDKFYVLGDLYDLLNQVHADNKDIGQLLIGQRKGETEKAREGRLSFHVEKFHRDAVMKLVIIYWVKSQGELISRILHHHLSDVEQMLAMKRRLRMIVGECMFNDIEMKEPIIFRIDLIEPAHLLSICQKVLSVRVHETNEKKLLLLLYQISIPRAVSIILEMKLGRQREGDDMSFLMKFQEFWKKNVRQLGTNFTAVMRELTEFLTKAGDKQLAEFNEELVKKERVAVLSLFQTEKLGKKFKQFLDGTKGAKGRLIHLFAYGVDTHKFVLENQELTRLIEKQNPSDEEMLNMLIKAYIKWFSASTDVESQKAHLAADLVLQVRELSRKFDRARDQWTLYCIMFLIILDQLEDAEPGFVQMFAPLYKQMLFKLWELELEDAEHLDFEAVLSREFRLFAQFNVANDTETLPPKLTEFDEKMVDEIFKKDHLLTFISQIKGTKYEEQLKSGLTAEGRNKLNTFINEEVTSSVSSVTPENSIVLASTFPSTSASSSSKTPGSSYYECPTGTAKYEQLKKNIRPEDKGYYEFKSYENYLTLNGSAREEWKEQIDLHMTVWHYSRIIEETIESIGNKLPKDLDGINDAWKLLKSLATKERGSLERKLCKFFRFLYGLYGFLIEGKDKEEILIVEALMKQIEMIVVFTDDHGATFLNANKLHCDNSDSPDIAKKMIKKLGKKEEPHFHYLNFLFKEHDVFNVLFCAQYWLIKDTLCDLIGPKLLELLERLHPEVLKINALHDDVRFYLYKQFVENRKGSKEAIVAEHRLIFTLSLMRLEQTLFSIIFRKKNVYEAAQKKLKWLKQLIFGNPKGLASARNICLIGTLRSMIEDEGKSQKDPIELIAAWDGQKCEHPEYADMLISLLRIEFVADHNTFLFFHSSKTNQLLKTPGHKARFQRLIPEQKLIYHLQLSITSDGLLRDQIQFVLLTEDEEKREMHRLALNFVSWARWMDAELSVADDMDKSMGKQNLRELWNEHDRRERILRKFDDIFDEFLSDLQGQFGLRLARMQAGLRDLVRNWRDSKVNSKEKLRRMFDEEMEPSKRSIHQWNQGKKSEFELWLQHLNRQEMLKQLMTPQKQDQSNDNNNENEEYKASEAWRLELKHALEKDKNARKRLTTLFGRERAEIEPILKALSLDVDIEELGLIEEELKDEKTEEVLLNDVQAIKQKKKAKTGKKKGQGKAHSRTFNQIHHGTEQSAIVEASEDKDIGSISNQAVMVESLSQTVHQRRGEEEADHHDKKIPSASDSKSKVKEEADSEGIEKGTNEVNVQQSADSSMVKKEKASSTNITSLAAGDEEKSSEFSASKIEDHETQAALRKSREMEATTPLLDILKEAGYQETPDLNRRIEAAIEEMRTIVQGWNKEASLLVGGSYLLKLHTTRSDIDTVLLLPFEEKSADDWIELRQQQFFGHSQIGTSNDEAEEEDICNLESTERHCPNSSLYCDLCRNTDVTFLMRMNGRDGDPMLKLKFRDIDFDISFVPVPRKKLEKFYAGSSEKDTFKLLSSVRKFDLLFAGFIDWIGFDNRDSRKGMLWALSAYRANLRIRDLLKGKPEKIFEPALLALKLWAKNHFVYGSILGLLNGTALTAMLLDVFLKNSHDSIPSLLEKFFDTFYHWDWPKLVELNRAFKLDPVYEAYDWKENMELNARGNQLNVHVYKFLNEHAQLIWPVIVPGFPTQNAAFNVNGWTKQAIQNEFGKASDQMKVLREKIGGANEQSIETEVIKEEWRKWLDGGLFENKYDHFVSIVCAANSAQQLGKFCDFVETRIRLQLLFAFGDLPKVVKWMHVSPEKVRNGASCPSGEEMAHQLPAVTDGHWLCTVWLVGIKLADGMEQGDKQQILREKLTQMDFTNEHNEAAKETMQPSRLENFTQKIYGSFRYRESRATASSPRIQQRSNSSSLPTYNYSVDSPRSSVGSPRGTQRKSSAESPRQSTPEFPEYKRQSSMPILRHSAPEYIPRSLAASATETSMSSAPVLTQQCSKSMLRHSAPEFIPRGTVTSVITRQGSNQDQIIEGEEVINEKVWAKYMDKAQLQAWLLEMNK